MHTDSRGCFESLQETRVTSRVALRRLQDPPEPAAGPSPQKRARGESTSKSERTKGPEGRGPEGERPEGEVPRTRGVSARGRQARARKPRDSGKQGVVATTPLGEPQPGKRARAASQGTAKTLEEASAKRAKRLKDGLERQAERLKARGPRGPERVQAHVSAPKCQGPSRPEELERHHSWRPTVARLSATEAASATKDRAKLAR